MADQNGDLIEHMSYSTVIIIYSTVPSFVSFHTVDEFSVTMVTSHLPTLNDFAL